MRAALIPWILGGLAAACASQKVLQVTTDTPPAFDNQTADGVAVWPGQEWYRNFGSDQLDTLVERAAAGNWDLAAARARVVQADARARQAGAAILPSVDAAGYGNYLAGHSSAGSGHELDWSALMSASYEVDFWGTNRATANSAVLLGVASRAQRDALALTTSAGVADTYFQVLALRERLMIARANLDAARGLKEVVQARYDAGSASPVELATQGSGVSLAAAVLPELQQQEGEARAALAILTGRVPEGFDVGPETLNSLTDPAVVAGLPSELLGRRPDILAAEANLRSAHADVAVARSAMFPSLNLNVAAGVQNPALNAAILAIPGTGPTLALSGSLAQVIFHHGRLQAQRSEAEARREELLASYRLVIAEAFLDVENALSAIRRLQEARPFQTEGLLQDERAFEGAKLRYQAGSSDYLTLLDAQRVLYAARDRDVQYRLARLQAVVTLYKALGGGWAQPKEWKAQR